MSAIIKTLRSIRNNWKKSLFGAVVLTYGSNLGIEKYKTAVFMRAMCEEAIKYGDEKINPEVSPRLVTVILNPVANRRKAKNDYEKYCEPLLHLAGIMVNVVSTTSEGGAKDVINELTDTDAIIVAGGDGTLSETVTGLLRMGIDINKCPIGILPLGRTNTVANKLFPTNKTKSKNEKIKQLATATLAVIKGDTRYKDVMKVEAIETDEELPGKPIYALSSVEWGAYRDALARRDKYWIYGSLRDYATFLFNGYKSSLMWNCSGTLKYSSPCTGCKNCTQARVKAVESSSSWSLRSMFMPKQLSQIKDIIDYSHVENDDCPNILEKCFKTIEVNLIMSDMDYESSLKIPHLKLWLGLPHISYINFVSQGWNRVNSLKPTSTDSVTARRVELLPKELPKAEENLYYSIDNEDFDVRPVRITIMPKAILMYCDKNNKSSNENLLK